MNKKIMTITMDTKTNNLKCKLEKTEVPAVPLITLLNKIAFELGGKAIKAEFSEEKQ